MIERLIYYHSKRFDSFLSSKAIRPFRRHGPRDRKTLVPHYSRLDDPKSARIRETRRPFNAATNSHDRFLGVHLLTRFV